MGKKWRPNSSEYVIKHINHVVENYNIDHICFNDDNLTLDKKRIVKILDYLIQEKVDITWDTPNGIRADGLNRDIFLKMKESGCTKLSIGVESGDPYILKNIIQKNLQLEDVIKTSEICKEYVIPLSAFFVIGFPGEKKENMEKTVRFAEHLKEVYDVNPLIMIATPLVKTRLYDICSKNGYFSQDLSPRAFAEATQFYGHGLIRTEDFTPEDVKNIISGSKRRLKIISIKKYFKNPTLFILKLARAIKFSKREIMKFRFSRERSARKFKLYVLRS
jgi:magnesium-protoporphyrin IX monomethyl ester (oxidative) cyclase